MALRSTGLATIVGAALLAAAPATVQPAPLAAQEAVAEVSDEELTALARLHLAVSEAREAFHAELGRVHTDAGREELREALAARLAGIFAEHGSSPEAYERLVFVVSSDPGTREAFEAILAELEQAGG